MQQDEIDNRFNHHPPTSDERANAHRQVRDLCAVLAEGLNVLVPEGREKSLAMTNLEQVMFWANAGVARQPQP